MPATTPPRQPIRNPIRFPNGFPNRHPIRFPVLLLAALVGLAGSTAGGAVYRCQGDRDIPVFSQFPCDPSAADGVLQLEPLSVLALPPLSDAERRRLASVERDLRARRSARVRAAAQARRQARRRQQARAERCRAARLGLTALERQRRSGYSLRQAPALDRREAELAATIRSDC